MSTTKRNENLSSEAKKVLYEQGTEVPFTGKYYNNHESGVYRCAGCGTQLFASGTKFDSGTGWPSFTKALPGATTEHEDNAYGMKRIEVRCAKCGGHLGHIFPDGPDKGEHDEGTGARLCINSCALDFTKRVNMKKVRTVRTWIEIDQKAIEKNFRVFRAVAGKKTALAGVIKSNAYGHNLYLYAKELERLGIDLLAVDSLIEGISLRKAGITAPMLVLGYTLPSLYKKAGEHGIALAISSPESLNTLTTYRGRPLAIHIKVDTGMHRQGFQLHQKNKVIELLTRLPKTVRIEGLFTHFAEAKKPKDSARTRAQIALFKEWKNIFEQEEFKVVSHTSATGGALVYPESHEDMVRIGIGLYGIWPSLEVKKYRNDLTLHPVLSWRAIVSEIKTIQKGEAVGYDFTEKVKRNSTIAVIPIGYWHGFPRLLSGKAHVLIHGKRAKVLGRVSMDMIVVDITGISRVKIGDTATLIGRDGKEVVTAEEMAHLAHTTAYEILTRLNPRMEHVLA